MKKICQGGPNHPLLRYWIRFLDSLDFVDCFKVDLISIHIQLFNINFIYVFIIRSTHCNIFFHSSFTNHISHCFKLCQNKFVHLHECWKLNHFLMRVETLCVFFIWISECVLKLWSKFHFFVNKVIAFEKLSEFWWSMKHTIIKDGHTDKFYTKKQIVPKSITDTAFTLLHHFGFYFIRWTMRTFTKLITVIWDKRIHFLFNEHWNLWKISTALKFKHYSISYG
jgi:hypothetical protein